MLPRNKGVLHTRVSSNVGTSGLPANGRLSQSLSPPLGSQVVCWICPGAMFLVLRAACPILHVTT